MDFIDKMKDGMAIPLGTIKVDTPIEIVPPKSFTGDLGLLTLL